MLENTESKPPNQTQFNSSNSDLRAMQDIEHFSREVIKQPLYAYQLAPARAILGAIRQVRGDEFLLVMSRQSGKNELISQLLAYLLNLFHRCGGNIVYAAIGDNIGRGLRRLELHLDNHWNKGQWQRQSRPSRRALGKASVVFISSHPQAHARGETAHHLLVVDELQDQHPSHLQAVFQPMRAANNATAVYLGTVRTIHDALWHKKEELERLQARDGRQRVFIVGPDQVCAENPAYARFLHAQVAVHGRLHPLIASEYYLEPLDDHAALFNRRRLTLMRGSHFRRNGPHPRQHAPRPLSLSKGSLPALSLPSGSKESLSNRSLSLSKGSLPALSLPNGSKGITIATLDVAGIDEAATDPTVALANPARDYTTCTIFRVVMPEDELETENRKPYTENRKPFTGTRPIYHAIDIFVDHGSSHFKQHARGAPGLAHQLLAYLQHWQVTHLIGDATGVGESLLNWLSAELGPGLVFPFKFTRRSKAQLGVDFLALVETNRFKYWAQEHDYDDAWHYFTQARACTSNLPPGQPMQTHLQWSVPAAARISTPTGTQPIHDDRLISAALIAEADRLIHEGKISTGVAHSAVLPASDPLDNLPDW